MTKTASEEKKGKADVFSSVLPLPGSPFSIAISEISGKAGHYAAFLIMSGLFVIVISTSSLQQTLKKLPER